MHTVDEMLDRYERECMHTLGARTSKDYHRHLKHLHERFGDQDVQAITPQRIRDFVQSGPTKGKVHRIRRIAVLRKAFTEAQRKWQWVNGNPCAHLERNDPRRRDPPLSMQEFNAALDFLKSRRRITLVMELALHTGQSQSDILGLTWSRVHRQTNNIVFRDAKKKKHNKVEVDMTPKIKELLAEAKELCGDSAYVITGREGEPYVSDGFRAMWTRWMERFEEAGNDKFTFHDIRYLSRKIAEQKYAQAADPVDDYPEFDTALKAESAINAPYYKVFYCLEQLIRKRVIETMERAAGPGWWNTDLVPQEVRRYAKEIMNREVNSALTQRSRREIDYTALGHLGEIIQANWEGLFDHQFTTRAAVSSVIHRLNMARGPVAHNSPISQLETERLGITIRDWFDNALKKQPG